MSKKGQYLPIRAFILVYLVLAILGFVLLQLPGAASRPLTSLEALFTTISAITLTGLQVCDFVSLFTIQGQVIVLGLIQLGAITLISFCLYFGWLSGKAYLFTDDTVLSDPVTKPLRAYRKILLMTILFLVFFELVSMGIIYAFWTGDMHYSPDQKFHFALFHGISVFCHSGFSTLDGNFSNTHVSHSYLLLLALTGVMVLGSTGYAAIFDLISIKRLRARMLDPSKNWTLQTRVALYGTLVLMAGGSIVWFVLERNRSGSSQKMLEAVFTSIFNTIGARGAGFYSVKMEAISSWLPYLYMILMLIGVSATAAGGGLKTSLIYAAFSGNSGLLKKTAKLLFVYTSIILLMSLLILNVTDPLFSARSLRFEVISAFTNTGLSFGITPHMSMAGKYVLMADMILGRIGIPVLVFLLLNQKNYDEDLLPA
jgi:trk system potassium uptake protein